MERGEGGAATIVNKSTFVCCVSSCCALCCCSLLNTPASSPLPHHPRWFYAPIFLPSRYLPPILMSSAMLLLLLSFARSFTARPVPLCAGAARPG